MFATATARKLPFRSALEGLRTACLSVTFKRGRARVVYQETADQNCIPRHAVDDLDLLSGEGCVTDWGLVECAGRLRSGWS